MLFLVAGLWGCAGSTGEWPRSSAIDAGGFTVRMPVVSGAQNGSFVLGLDTVNSHVNILADSGITYVAAWFDAPAGLRELPAQVAVDSVWSMMVDRIGGIPTDGVGPLQTPAPLARSGWFVNADDIRIGLVVRAQRERFVVMNTTTPAPRFGPREERNMLRFLNSYEQE